ncbi:LWR-salt protein [Halopenitus persicus]|uniref:LWR-salt protein n=1 Tax=Halopenitus persicus TaxID=1048396 RepID=UPI000BBB29E9|nr:LWR-salt protein [Halopenitus persicus]
MITDGDPGRGNAAYVFRVTLRFDPAAAEVSPDRFETTVRVPAPEPGTDGWLLFRDRLWHGELGDPERFHPTVREVLGLGDAPGVAVDGVAFRELRTDEAYLQSLRATIESDPSPFAAADAETVLHQYFGSSIHVRD